MSSKSKKPENSHKARPKHNLEFKDKKIESQEETTISKPDEITVERPQPILDSNLRNKPKKLPFKSPLNSNQLIALATGIVAIAGTMWLSLAYIPKILEQTDEAKIEKQKKDEEDKKKNQQEKRDKQIAEENKVLNFEAKKDWQLALKIKIQDVGDEEIKLNLKENYAPKTVENFIRLSSRGYYKDTIFHRMVKGSNFQVIQGGDPEGTGTGGESAFGSTIPDELWKVKPQYETTPEGETKLKNKPELTDSSLYNFDADKGVITYRKGLIIMAKTEKPDSAGSQFFITLDDTILPADYTAFGTVDPSSFSALEKIAKEVNPIAQSASQAQQTPSDILDGKPSKEIKIQEIKIL